MFWSLQVELKRLEDLSESIVQDFNYMRQREVGVDDSSDGKIFIFLKFQEEMRDTNENTNSRVLYFSIFSMCCLLGLATWQVGFYQVLGNILLHFPSFRFCI